MCADAMISDHYVDLLFEFRQIIDDFGVVDPIILKLGFVDNFRDTLGIDACHITTRNDFLLINSE